MTEKYKILIGKVAESLKTKGWSKKGNAFYLLTTNNWLIIDFQKSRDSSANEITFTINLGVSSTELRKFDEKDISQKPSVWEAHWRKRIGFLLPVNDDYWWPLNENVDLEKLASEIIAALDKFAIPELHNRSSDTQLEQLWLTGASDGLTELQRLIYLSTLLKRYNRDNLNPIIEELTKFAKGRPYESTAREHINELRKNE